MEMDVVNMHTMRKIKTNAGDDEELQNYALEEEYKCDECGRKLRITYPPHYNKVVLEKGNEFEDHSSGLIGNIKIKQ
jgi:rRNA maturation protein Nop10